MFKASVIGNLGADCRVVNDNGHSFVSFRVAHQERYTKADGTQVERSQWVDCVLPYSNDVPRVTQYLVRGASVYVTGDAQLRVFSSKIEKCFKAGITLHVRDVQLLGGRSDEVPSRLYDEQGRQVDVTKYYHVDMAGCILLSKRNERYAVDDNGWVFPYQGQDAVSSVQQSPNDGGGAAAADTTVLNPNSGNLITFI